MLFLGNLQQGFYGHVFLFFFFLIFPPACVTAAAPRSTPRQPQEHGADLPVRMALHACFPPAVFIVWPFRGT